MSLSALALSVIAKLEPALAEESQTVELAGSYRLRYESLQDPFRLNSTGSDQMLVSRLLVSLKAGGERWFGELEIEDSRTWLDDIGSPLGTDDVNSLEPLQAYLGWRSDAVNVKLGRFTMDLGSRRLLARNRFRNTLNSFSGLQIKMQRQDWNLQAFYTSPLKRLPDDRNSLDANSAELDRSSSDRIFWGVYAGRDNKAKQPGMELYLLGINEEATAPLTASRRDYLTVGGRMLSQAQPGRWDYEMEAAFQFGDLYSPDTQEGVRTLDHEAFFVHAQVAYQSRGKLNSRWELQLDYASGDQDPGDGENGRFDTLYGARRFEFGPTGIYGAFARANIFSPALRWEFSHAPEHNAFIGYRAVWLAQGRDAWTTSGLRDSSGDSGRFVGHQVEARWRLPLANVLSAEFGGSYLFKERFVKQAGTKSGQSDSRYVYTAVTYRF